MRAIDISAHQGVVNVKAIRNSGVERIILRAGYGRDNTDKKFHDNAQAMINLGVEGGIYWFSYALSIDAARNEGKYAVEHARKYWNRCVIAFDFEYDSTNYCRKNGVAVDKNMCTAMAIAFLDEVVKAGYIPCIYTNQDYLNNWFDMKVIKQYIPDVKLWLACWYNENKQDIKKPLPANKQKETYIWQYSSKGKVPGISGNVDMDEWYGDVANVSDPKPLTPVCNINVLNFQKAINADAKKKKLVEDGIDGPKTQAARMGIDLTVKSRGEVVRWLQTRLVELGAKIEIDGIFGQHTRKAVIEFQKENGLATDGIAGYNTITRLFYV